MKFHVEIAIKDRTVKKSFIVDSLQELEALVKKEFKTGKIISIIGGGDG